MKSSRITAFTFAFFCGSVSAQELLTGRRRAVVRESERNRSFQFESRRK